MISVLSTSMCFLIIKSLRLSPAKWIEQVAKFRFIVLLAR